MPKTNPRIVVEASKPDTVPMSQLPNSLLKELLRTGSETAWAEAVDRVWKKAERGDYGPVPDGAVKPGQRRGSFSRAYGAGKAEVAGLAVTAADTGRVLMIQRAYDERDPAGGMFEFPGGHLENGETPLDGAIREWEEETGLDLPAGKVVGEWKAGGGRYCGYVYRIPHEGDLDILDGRDASANPDADGDLVEVISWWDCEYLSKDNPALRSEIRDTLDDIAKAMPKARKARERGYSPLVARVALAIVDAVTQCEYTPRQRAERSDWIRAARRPARFDPDARDADRDQLVQEGTPYERPAVRRPAKKAGGRSRIEAALESAKVRADVVGATPEQAARLAPVKAAKGPLTAEPAYMRRQAAVSDVLDAPGATERRAVGRQGATIVSAPDGRVAVRKSFVGAGGQRAADAEELASRVAEAVGVRAPAVVRRGQSEIGLEFIDGTPGTKIVPLSQRVPQDILDSGDGRLVGLVDLLIRNSDRSPGNWIMVADGRLAMVDFADAFQPGALSGARSEFAGRYVVRRPDGTFEWAPTIDLSPAELVAIRARLEALEPTFAALGRQAWHRSMMSNLDQIERRVPGARPKAARLAPVKAAKKAAPAVEPAGTVRATRGFDRFGGAERRIVADGKGGYIGQRREAPRGGDKPVWRDDPSLGTGPTVADILSGPYAGTGWRRIAAPRPAAKATPAKKVAAPKAPVKAPVKAAKKAAPRIASSPNDPPTDLDKRIRRRYEAGESLSQVASAEGISSTTVSTSLQRQGVQLRPRGGKAAPAKAVKATPAKATPAKVVEPAGTVKATLAPTSSTSGEHRVVTDGNGGYKVQGRGQGDVTWVDLGVTGSSVAAVMSRFSPAGHWRRTPAKATPRPVKAAATPRTEAPTGPTAQSVSVRLRSLSIEQIHEIYDAMGAHQDLANHRARRSKKDDLIGGWGGIVEWAQGSAARREGSREQGLRDLDAMLSRPRTDIRYTAARRLGLDEAAAREWADALGSPTLARWQSGRAATPRKATGAAPSGMLRRPFPDSATDAKSRLVHLRDIHTTEQADDAVAGLSRPELLGLARELSVPNPSSMTIADLRKEIVLATVGRRLESIAIRGFTGPRPDEPGESASSFFARTRREAGLPPVVYKPPASGYERPANSSPAEATTTSGRSMFAFSSNGLTASLDRPAAPDVDGVIRAEGQIRDGNGGIVGSFRYHLDPATRTAHLDSIALSEQQRGQGFTSSFVDHVERGLVADGYTTSTVDAAYGGGAFWARRGYGWDLDAPGAFGDVPTRVIDRLVKNPDGPDAAMLQGWLDRFGSSDRADWPSPREIVDAGPLGRDIMDGSSWRGRKTLGSTAPPGAGRRELPAAVEPMAAPLTRRPSGRGRPARMPVPVASSAAEVRSDYRAGEWQAVPEELLFEMRAKELFEWERSMRDYRLSRQPGWAGSEPTDDALWRFARETAAHEVDLFGQAAWTWVNGPHRVMSFTLDRDVRVGGTERLATAVEALLARYPIARARVAFTESMQVHHLGEYVVGSKGDIRLDPRVLRGFDPAGKMPAAHASPSLEYVLAHEWGHALHDIHGSDLPVEVVSRLVNHPEMSEYGRKNFREAVAEAFAEWFLTGGKTTNGAARAFAAEFGW